MVAARLTISTLSVVGLLAASAARAADYSPPPPQPIYVQPQPVIEEFSSWYLRGDIGFSNQQLGYLNNVNYSLTSFVQNVDRGFDSAPFFGIGIGYNFNDWLRFDVTGEYRGKANFHGLDIGRDNTGAPFDDNYSGSKSELTFLANAYVDLGTWYNVTPFVGAGIGMSRNTISSFRDTSVAFLSDVYGETASKWSLAWALHAGLAYKVTKNFTIELAYRYLNLGDATTGAIKAYDGSSNPSYTPFEFHNLTSHDIKLGLRFNLDGFADCCRPVQYYAPPQPTYAPPPVYAPVYAPPPPLRSKG
jgi:opacity protein-like surface antigen